MKIDSKYSRYYHSGTESLFDEMNLRRVYTKKLEGLSAAEREAILCVAKTIIEKVKEKRGSASFGADSALQLIYMLGTFLNDKYPDVKFGGDGDEST